MVKLSQGFPARDPFVSGPLQDPQLGGEQVVQRYLSLTYPTHKFAIPDDAEDEDSADEASLPPTESLRRAGVIPALFDYQQDLASQIASVARTPPPDNSALLALPTGAGKTRTALFAILQLFEDAALQNVLWLAPSRELLDQAFSTVRTLWRDQPTAPDIELYRCHALREFPPPAGPAIYFSTPQMLVPRVKRGKRGLPIFDFIIFDEAHHSEAPTFKDVLTTVRSLGPRTAPALGLSATPGRMEEDETESLVKLFRRRLLTSSLLLPNALVSLQQRGILAKLEFRRIDLPIKLIGQSRVIESRQQLAKSFKHLEADLVRFRAAAQTIAQLARKTRALVFSGSIRHANALGVVLEHLGCPVGIVTSRTPLEERAALLSAFAADRIRVLVNKTILATGYDCPAVKNVVLTTPIGSPILFEQIVGRASRGPKVGGSKSATIWQIDDNLAIHGKPSSYHRYRDFDWQ